MFTPPTGGLSSAAIAALTELLAAGFAAGDELVVNDVSASQVKKVQAQNLLEALLLVSSGTLRIPVSGQVRFAFNNSANDFTVANGGAGVPIFQLGGANCFLLRTTTFEVRSDALIAWQNSTNVAGGSKDTALARAAAKVVALTDASTAGATLRSVPATVFIGSDTNDASLGVARYYRLSSSADRTITGVSVAQVDGQEAEIWNVGSFNLTLSHQSASSSAGNRFICTGAANIVLAPDEIALLRYDATTSRWRVRKV